jgi:hypothetical protein
MERHLRSGTVSAAFSSTFSFLPHVSARGVGSRTATAAPRVIVLPARALGVLHGFIVVVVAGVAAAVHVGQLARDVDVLALQ